MAKKSPVEDEYIKGSVHSENYQRLVNLLENIAHSRATPEDVLAKLLLVEHFLGSGEYTMREAFTGIVEKIEELDKRTLDLKSASKKLEADVDGLKEKKVDVETEREWPSYASEDFEKIAENARELKNAVDDKSQILYRIMEIETLLGRVEEKGRATKRKYEARLAASLRDICRIHEPNELSENQIKRFVDSVRALIEGWGKLNREKVNWIRARLLETGLTWLPVTEKAQNDIAEAKNSLG